VVLNIELKAKVGRLYRKKFLDRNLLKPSPKRIVIGNNHSIAYAFEHSVKNSDRYFFVFEDSADFFRNKVYLS